MDEEVKRSEFDYRLCLDGTRHEWAYRPVSADYPHGCYVCQRCGVAVDKETLKEALD